MHKNRLGRTDIHVSKLCLGTMTWGEQNTEAEAHQQIDYALERGINFLDTAEMYPVPPRGETQGLTEQYIGTWLAARGGRDRAVIATKAAGAGRGMGHIRGGKARFDAANLEEALEASLRRLQTDYVDLYQLHWPDRPTNIFGVLGYQHPAETEDQGAPLDETLRALDRLVRAGKIRAIGISNETPWGMAAFLKLSEQHGWPRMASIQNAYSLVNRTFEVGLAEIAIREECGLLAYSPLAGGFLSGKYLGGAKPAGARMTLFKRFTRYDGAEGQKAIAAYVALARQHGLDPSQMALAYVNSRPFLTSNIIGATTLAQLKTDIDSLDVTLDDAVLTGIEAIQKEFQNPCP
ncbi:MAG TPA: NADP(H)-dependent aldo-keto reductase [Stellaceae bacterium]|nr:NADP(H)-dependent aldo-keto reductase [Stellaceae bacterium]